MSLAPYESNGSLVDRCPWNPRSHWHATNGECPYHQPGDPS